VKPKAFLLKTALFFLVSNCIAQNKDSSQPLPNLSGRWERDESRSRSIKEVLPRGAVKLAIAHRDPELRIIRLGVANDKQVETNLLYYTDERGENNRVVFALDLSVAEPGGDPFKVEELKSKTKYEGRQLVSRSFFSQNAFGGDYKFRIDVIEKRELSSDGKTLTIVTLFNSLRGQSSITEVFNRVP
jgi:hypothetical protein